jgi:hypothetical protein
MRVTQQEQCRDESLLAGVSDQTVGETVSGRNHAMCNEVADRNFESNRDDRLIAV